MSHPTQALYLSQDSGLLLHWTQSLGTATVCHALEALDPTAIGERSLLWVDLALPQLPAWTAPVWRTWLPHPALRVIATSSHPKDSEAVAALDAGCAGYCHAYAAASTLRQVEQVVQAGHVWIGAALMQRLIRTAQHAVKPPPNKEAWSQQLTARETQVALMAAKGASNQDIAIHYEISERTVKAHLSAVFSKLGIADRLQLALKVHGIQ